MPTQALEWWISCPPIDAASYSLSCLVCCQLLKKGLGEPQREIPPNENLIGIWQVLLQSIRSCEQRGLSQPVIKLFNC